MAKKIKKDFDKDKMYQKIMPSIEPEGEEQLLPPKEPQQQPELVDTVTQEEEEIGLHNLMEQMLRERMDRTITTLDGCGCERCRMDTMAMALNMLPPAYGVVKQRDPAYIKKLRGIYEIKVTASLIKAVQQVKTMPRHHSQDT